MSDEVTAKPFWVVWCPAARPPFVRHDTEQRAVEEAERLARQYIGETFYVLRSVAARQSLDMLTPPSACYNCRTGAAPAKARAIQDMRNALEHIAATCGGRAAEIARIALGVEAE